MGVVARGKKAQIRLRQLYVVVGKKEEENKKKKKTFTTTSSLTIFYATITTTTTAAAATSAICSMDNNIITSSVIYDRSERLKLNRVDLIQVIWLKIIIILQIPRVRIKKKMY